MTEEELDYFDRNLNATLTVIQDIAIRAADLAVNPTTAEQLRALGAAVSRVNVAWAVAKPIIDELGVDGFTSDSADSVTQSSYNLFKSELESLAGLGGAIASGAVGAILIGFLGLTAGAGFLSLTAAGAITIGAPIFGAQFTSELMADLIDFFEKSGLRFSGDTTVERLTDYKIIHYESHEGADFYVTNEGASIIGSDGDDLFFGSDRQTNGDDVLQGLRGDDEIYGQAGDDQIWGDQGEDKIDGGKGDDQLHGGIDDDELNGGEGWTSSGEVMEMTPYMQMHPMLTPRTLM